MNETRRIHKNDISCIRVIKYDFSFSKLACNVLFYKMPFNIYKAEYIQKTNLKEQGALIFTC